MRLLHFNSTPALTLDKRGKRVLTVSVEVPTPGWVPQLNGQFRRFLITSALDRQVLLAN